MSSALLEMVNKNMRDYSIHILCGGNTLNIGTRLSLQLVLIVIISLIPSLLIFKFSISMVFTVLLALIICSLILIPPFIKLRNTSIALMVRRSE